MPTDKAVAVNGYNSEVVFFLRAQIRISYKQLYVYPGILK